MHYAFHRTDEGSVDVTVADDLSLLQDALSDSLGTRAPRGAAQDGPSTYWLDNAIAHLRERMQSGSPEPFASGSITYLRLANGWVKPDMTTTR